jgi:hypothetical protein
VNHVARNINLVNATGLEVGDQWRPNTGWGDALPNDRWYYVISKSGNFITVSDRPGGTVLFPSALPTGITMTFGANTRQVLAVDTVQDAIALSDTAGLVAGTTQVQFSESFQGVVGGTPYTVRTIIAGSIQLTAASALLNLVDATALTRATTALLDLDDGSLIAKTPTRQTFTIDTRQSAAASQMPGGGYTLAMFEGGTNPLTNALHGKQLNFTNGITSTLTLSCTVQKENANSQLSAAPPPGRPGIVPKITISFTASAGTLADFEIINFTNATLGFENQTILNTGTQGVSQPMFSPRYVLLSSSLRTPGQVPGGRVRFNPIATIPMQTIFGGVQAYIPPSPIEQIIDDNVIRSFTLQVYDELGNLLNFNGVEWQAVLEFKMIPKRKPEYKYSW